MKELTILLCLMLPTLGFTQSPAVMNKSMATAAEPAPAAALASTFTAKSVNEPQVSAFQQRGIQKLKDFYNYLTIISNPTYDKRLREDAKSQANQLFYGTDCKVDGKIVSGFIDSCFNLNKAVDWKALDVSILQSMTAATNADGTVIYYGEVTFKESVDAMLSGFKKAQIVLSKGEKQFGEKKKEVWSVFICSIE
jgi:hypothetical protein